MKRFLQNYVIAIPLLPWEEKSLEKAFNEERLHDSSHCFHWRDYFSYLNSGGVLKYGGFFYEAVLDLYTVGNIHDACELLDVIDHQYIQCRMGLQSHRAIEMKPIKKIERIRLEIAEAFTANGQGEYVSDLLNDVNEEH